MKFREIIEGKEHPAYKDLMNLAKIMGKAGDSDTRAIQVLAGKIANFTVSGNRGLLADLGKYFKELNSDARDAFISIMQKHDKSLLKSIVFKSGLKIAEEEELEEISSKKLKRYVDKSIEDQAKMAFDGYEKNKKKINKRIKGMAKAQQKISDRKHFDPVRKKEKEMMKESVELNEEILGINDTNIGQLISYTLHFIAQAHIWHLLCPNGQKHTALGELYEELQEEVDGLAEKFIAHGGELKLVVEELSPVYSDELVIAKINKFRELITAEINVNPAMASIVDGVTDLQEIVDAKLYMFNLS